VPDFDRQNVCDLEVQRAQALGKEVQGTFDSAGGARVQRKRFRGRGSGGARVQQNAVNA